MFTYIKLKNYKSFKEITLDLQTKKKEAKPLVVIYGANGSGKSTIVQAFLTLQKTMRTMQVKDLLKDLLENKIDASENTPFNSEMMIEFIKSRLANNTIETIIEESKMIDSYEDMYLEFGFEINKSSGTYIMEFDNSDIIHERLEYKISKNRGCFFDIRDEKIEINNKTFESNDYLQEIRKQLNMYWGKHSFLSILNHELDEKAGAYINSNISTNLMEVILEFSKISYKIKSNLNVENASLLTENQILRNLEFGTIEKNQEINLSKVESVLNRCFTSLFDDVNKVFYKKQEDKGDITYNLYFNKIIENHTYDIDFKYESSGTQEILELIPFLMLAISGECVIIDEFGCGVHDLLVVELMKVINKEISGQLIMTTHNTILMDHAEIKAEALYFILNNKKTRKSVKCVTEIEERTHRNYNYRNRYFNNAIYRDGLPQNKDKIDFSELADLYKNK